MVWERLYTPHFEVSHGLKKIDVRILFGAFFAVHSDLLTHSRENDNGCT